MVPMDLYRIFYFTAKHKNITKAAESLYISQPAVSKAVKNLEEYCNCKLFIRSSKGVRLTSEGAILFNHIESAFECLFTGEKLLFRLANREEGIIRIGISNTLCKFYLLPHIKSFHRKYPNIKINVLNRASTETFALMAEGQLDFVITSSISEAKSYKVINLMEIQDIFVTNKKTEELCGIIPAERLKGYPIIMLEKKNITREYVDSFLSKHNIALTPEIEMGSIDFLIEFAKIGLGIAAVIKEFVLEDLEKGLLQEIQVTPTIPKRKIGIALKKQIPISNAAEAFIEHLLHK